MKTGFVYFVRAKDGNGPIKIGYSWRPEQRLETLLTWSPVDLEILVAIDADIETEKAIDLTDIRGNLWVERYRRRSIANAARRAAIRGGAL